METIKLIIEEHKLLGNQLFKLAKSELIKTYRASAFGWAWALIKPTVRICVFWFAFTVGLRAGKPVEGYPYILWLVAGFLPWFYMQDMLNGGAGCIRKKKHLVTKMKFPVSTIPTFVSISHLYVHWVLLGITIVLFMCCGYMPDIYYLQIPFYMAIMFLFFTIWGLFAGLLSAISQDFQNLVRSFTQAIFWMSGVMYNVDIIHNPTIRLILKFNPITVVSSGYRRAFIYKQWFWEDPVELGCFCVTLVVFTLLALWAYKRLRKEIPDVL